MICSTCADKGIVRIWADSGEFALCLCSAGQAWRSTENAGRDTGYALWQVWCAREQVDPSQLYLLEEVMTAGELSAAGFQNGSQSGPASREAALLAAAKGKARVRL